MNGHSFHLSVVADGEMNQVLWSTAHFFPLCYLISGRGKRMYIFTCLRTLDASLLNFITGSCVVKHSISLLNFQPYKNIIMNILFLQMLYWHFCNFMFRRNNFDYKVVITFIFLIMTTNSLL